MTIDHQTSRPTPAAPSGARSNFAPGAEWLELLKAIGARISRSEFVEPALDTLERDFSFRLRSQARETAIKQAALDLARQAATEGWSASQISDKHLKIRAFGCIMRHASIAHVSQQFMNRGGLARTPYFFHSACATLDQWTDGFGPFARTVHPEKGMRRYMFGPSFGTAEVYTHPAFHRALGKVMIVAERFSEPSLEEAASFLREFDLTIRAERDGHGPSDRREEHIALGANAVDEMFETGGQGFESAQSPDPEAGPSPSIGVEPDAWIAVVAIEETERKRQRAQWILDVAYARLGEQAQKACRLVYARGLRNVQAASDMGIKPGTLGKLLSQIRTEFTKSASLDQSRHKQDTCDALSELLPEDANHLVDLICNGRL